MKRQHTLHPPALLLFLALAFMGGGWLLSASASQGRDDSAAKSAVPAMPPADFDLADALRAGGTVTLPPRDTPYVLDPMILPRPAHIVGHGAAVRIREARTARNINGLTLRAPITIEGLTVIAGGSYSAVSVESPGCVLEDVRVLDYSYKGIRVAFNDDEGGFIAQRCYASSDRGNGQRGYRNGGVYPLAYQVDAGPGKMIGRVALTDCVAGPHPNSAGGGSGIKVATVRSAVIERFAVTGGVEPTHTHTLVVGEGVDRLTVRDAHLPRGVVHFPDPAGGHPDVAYMELNNCVLGGPDAPGNLHDHLRARRLVYRGVDVRNIDNAAIIDETPGRNTRRAAAGQPDAAPTRLFEGCTFGFGDELRASHGRWDGQAYFAKPGTNARLRFAPGNELVGPEGHPPRWSLDDEREAAWEAGKQTQ